MDDISILLERFFSTQKDGLTSYFDVDEIVLLINHFLDIDDSVNLKTIIELGYELHPDDLHFKIALCRTLAAMEDYQSALQLIEDIHVEDNQEVDLVRIECYCELNQYSDAMDLIWELTHKNVSYLEEVIVHTACILNDIETYQDKALVFIKEALNRYPDNITLKSELCYNYELHGHTKEALRLCKELVADAPFSAELWYMQGRLYSVCADFEKAVDAFEFALSCMENNPELEYEVMLMKAWCLYKNEHYDKAIACYLELMLHVEYIRTQVDPYLAECYMHVNAYEKAYQILSHIVHEKGLDDEVSVYGNYIYCCIETDRKTEAIEVLSEALQRFPHSILEYISTLNIAKSLNPDLITGKEHLIYPGELARNYLSQHYHNN